MSQEGIVDITGGFPQIPTTFVTDDGDAVPIANVLEILGTTVPAGTVPLETTGSGNTVTIQAQLGQAFASSSATRAGLVSFDSASFSVDANGFVAFTGGGGFVTSVSGTANRITSTGGVTPVIDISAAYVGQTSLTTLGTITTGVWQGTAIGPTFGGTGQTTYATGDILYASAANTLSKLPVGSNTQVLTLAAGIPSWATPTTGTVTSVSGTANRITSTGGATPVIDIAATYVGQTSITTLGTITTGVWNGTTIAVANGGTGAASFTAYSVICAGTTSTGSFQNVSGVGTSGQVLTSGGAGTLPTWTTIGSSGGGKVTAQAFTSTGAFTYTPTANMVTCVIELVGAGGASGGCAGGAGLVASGSGGGGGGSYLKIYATAAQIGASASGSVGTGGTVGSAGNNAGNAGGNTTITIGGGTTWTAAGGSGGSGSTNNGAGFSVAGGGANTNTTGTNATLMSNITAQKGDVGWGFGASGIAVGGNGGEPGGPYGQGGWGAKITTSTTSTGNAANGVGGGGGGSAVLNSATNITGTAGSNGFVLVTEFLSG